MQIHFSIKQKILVGILLLLFLFFFFLSSLVKYFINTKGEEYSGRKIQLEELHFNYLKCAVKAKNLVVFEKNGKEVFASLEELYVDLEPWKLISNEYALAEIRLVHPYVSIVQSKDAFNFSDLTASSDSTSMEQDSLKAEAGQQKELKFSIRNIDISNGRVKYFDQVVDNHMDLNDLNLRIPEIAWNNRQSNVGVNFTIGDQGQVNITANVDHTNEAFGVAITTHGINIDFVTNYLKDYLEVEAIKGLFSSELNIHGNLNHLSQMYMNGTTRLNDFHLIAPGQKELFAANELELELDSIDMEHEHYGFGKASIKQPMVNVELFKEKTNWEQFLAPAMETDSTSTVQDTISSTETGETSSMTYALKEVVIENGSILFHDHTLNRPFSYDLQNMSIRAQNITDTTTNLPVSCEFNLKGSGKFKANGRFNLAEPFDMDVKGTLSNLSLLSFSPYSEYYIASPITQGTLNYDCSLSMTPKRLKNENHITISEMEFGKRTADKTAVKLPIRLALYVIKDKDDRIDIDLPVKGNPSEPGFRLGPIILKTLANFIVKAATQPFGALSRLVGTDPETIESLPFEYLQDSLHSKQIRTLDNIAKILTKKPDLVFTFTQQTDYEKEMIQLAIRNAWQQYQETLGPNPKPESVAIDKTNPGFREYLINTVAAAEDQTMEQQCIQLIGKEKLTTKLDQIIENRNLLVRNYLEKVKGTSPDALKVETADLQNLPEELKVTRYKIEVSVK